MRGSGTGVRGRERMRLLFSGLQCCVVISIICIAFSLVHDRSCMLSSLIINRSHFSTETSINPGKRRKAAVTSPRGNIACNHARVLTIHVPAYQGILQRSIG